MLALKWKPNFSKDNMIHIEAYSDNEFAVDRETSASVYDFVIFVCDATVLWKSRSKRSVLHYLQLKQNIMVHLKQQ
jgi:hypothetical protein